MNSKVENKVVTRRTLSLIFLLVLSNSIFAQLGRKEATQWHFGQSCALNFLTNPPSPINTSSMSSIEGCASIADASGNLQFYTNGTQVWNKLNVQMPNLLSGNQSSAQSSVILPRQGSKYFVFTTGAFGVGPLAYSVVDMNLSGGTGSVTNTYTLTDSVTEMLSATYHCNRSDIWVMAHDIGNNNFLAYLANPTGVNNSPVISSIGPVHNLNPFAFSTMKFSPQGNKLIVTTTPLVALSQNTIDLYDFNTSTGVLSNALNLGPFPQRIVPGLEFSPDGSKLYAMVQHPDSIISGLKYITQWDLCAGSGSAIIASQTTVGVIQGFTRILQNAPDGKIYFANTGSATVLGCINFPNSLGISCNLSNSVITLSTGFTGAGTLPNFITDYFRAMPTFSYSLACGLMSFSPQFPCTSYSASAYTWNFGDPLSGTSNTSSLSVAQHSYSSNGNYTVSMVAHFPCYSDTVYQMIQVNTLPNLAVQGRTLLCKGEYTQINFSGASTYTLNTQALGQSSVQLQPTVTTVYTLTGTGSTGCSAKKVFTITVLPCTALQENAKGDDMAIYPNPNNGLFTLELKEQAEVRIMDLRGQEVFKASCKAGKQDIDLSHKPKGLYLLEWRSTQGSGFMKVLKD